MAKKAAKAKARVKKARSKAKARKVVGKKKAAKKAVKKTAMRNKTPPKKAKKAAKKAPPRKAGGGTPLVEANLNMSAGVAPALALGPPAKGEAVVDCVNTFLDTNNPGWNADLKGEDRTLADLHLPPGLFLTQINKCLKPKGFKIVTTNALQQALGTGTISDIEIAIEDAVQSSAGGGAPLAEANLDMSAGAARTLALGPLTKGEAAVDCVNTFLNTNNPGWNADLQGEDKTLADLHLTPGQFVAQINKCLKPKGFKIVITHALEQALGTGTISDIEIAIEDAVQSL